MEVLIAILLGVGVIAAASAPTSSNGELISGGEARGRKPSDFSQQQLKRGTQVELEHVRGGRYSPSKQRAIAREIAMDHLAEDPDYYKKLAQIHPD